MLNDGKLIIFLKLSLKICGSQTNSKKGKKASNNEIADNKNLFIECNLEKVALGMNSFSEVYPDYFGYGQFS